RSCTVSEMGGGSAPICAELTVSLTVSPAARIPRAMWSKAMPKGVKGSGTRSRAKKNPGNTGNPKQHAQAGRLGGEARAVQRSTSGGNMRGIGDLPQQLQRIEKLGQLCENFRTQAQELMAWSGGSFGGAKRGRKPGSTNKTTQVAATQQT